ncbi:phage tail assembly chaperone [Heyndrickxia oleronia]|uniref:phage tail assembly chaperone n=1 Tax=Heyndrickxia oleronia TaxID=38875 RepID=UPI00242DEE02|nr:hypothetical protein [Heyndrickxia oleronia]MCI1592488.1 hypothetical protein [Heyndrickxia oleronia]MCI1615449.1 hypothetical protein [Heyndrickxia oleronia]MCI1746303.1 hypothetical protein [Heyndrickxia oleronia]MCI1763584.1 hypothetical protein [Heyndrickxia oleronia]
MTEIKKLTLTDLIKEKEKYQVKKDVTEELYIQRLDASITIRKPERSLCLDTISMSRDKDQADQADVYMAYNIVVEPDLKDPELQKAYGCVEPTDIVEKIFDPGEIASISQAGLELSGYISSAKRVKDLKN